MTPPFIPYYIDYNVKNQSKTIGVSKKKITFKFGFANQQAVNEGLVGAHCRGSEHEVVFTWSLNSGKRHVTLDGKDIHFSTSGQNGWTSDRTWQHVFSLKVPSYTGVFRCHLISQPAPQGSNIRPFDLRVGGVSLFKFNQIFQLGTPQMTVRKPGGGRSHGGHGGHGGGGYGGHGGGGYGGDGEESMSPEERRMLAAARAASMEEFRKEQEKQSAAAISASAASNGTGGPPAAAPASGDLLMNFDAPAPPPMPAQQAPGHHVSSLTVGSEFTNSAGSFPPAGPPGAPPGQQQSPYGYPQQQPQQQPGYGGYGQAPPPQQQPGYGGYGQAPPPQQQQQSYGQLPPQQSPFSASYSQPPGPGASTTGSFAGGSATTAPTANTSALTPYQAPAGQASAPAGYSLGNSFAGSSFSTAPTQATSQAPAPSLANSMDPYAKPPADPWASPAAPAPAPQQQSYGQQPPQQQSYGQLPPQQQNPYGGSAYGTQSQSSFPAMQSPTQASVGTYGSAPSFAQPPQAQQQQPGYGAPPAPYGQPAPAPAYGQPPAAGNPYAPPAQYQQQSFTGF